jgi:predicted DCC family thiol-disulfide oxidoreductase YuxK
MTQRIQVQDAHAVPDWSVFGAAVTRERCLQEMVLIEPGGRVSGGFYAFRRVAHHVPLLGLLVPVLYLPGVPWLGVRIYRWVAEHRYLILPKRCSSGTCSIHPT